MTVFYSATSRTFFFAMHAGAKELRGTFIHAILTLTKNLIFFSKRKCTKKAKAWQHKRKLIHAQSEKSQCCILHCFMFNWKVKGSLLYWWNIKAAALAMVKAVCSEDASKKLKTVPLSNNTLQQRIELSNNVKNQIVIKLKKSIFLAASWGNQQLAYHNSLHMFNWLATTILKNIFCLANHF